MKDVDPQIREMTSSETDAMVKRVFKVAELLAGHSTKTDGVQVENRRENHDSQEIDYCETENQQHI